MGWGWPEDMQCQIVGCGGVAQSYSYVERVNVEFMKLGLKGVTLVASAGDKGAPGEKDRHCKKGILTSMFPASSPWVTSVGATMLIDEDSRRLRKRQAQLPPECQQYVFNQFFVTFLQISKMYHLFIIFLKTFIRIEILGVLV